MLRFLTFGLFLSVSALVDAQFVSRIPPAKPLLQLPDTATILIMGDVMMHKAQISDALSPSGTYVFDTYFSSIEEMVRSADLAIANMEFTLAGEPYTGYPCFSAPDGFEEYVAGTGVDIFLTANNHILDRGGKGLLRTLERYARMEGEGLAKYVGTAVSQADEASRFPLIVAVKGVRIALINFTYGTNVEPGGGYPKVHLADKAEIAAAIRAARAAGAEFVIALPHWGTEYAHRHSASQASLAGWLADQGCDAVVGAHPHVVQDVGHIVSGGRYRAMPVIYSLGNIVSNMSAPGTRIGMCATIRIVTGISGGRRMLDPGLVFTWCTRPGTLTGSYATIPVKAFLGKRDLWKDPSDYDNMVRSYERVKAATGIEDWVLGGAEEAAVPVIGKVRTD